MSPVRETKTNSPCFVDDGAGIIGAVVTIVAEITTSDCTDDDNEREEWWGTKNETVRYDIGSIFLRI